MIGPEIRFKVKAVNFTRITITMKGVQATTTTSMSHVPSSSSTETKGIMNASGDGSATGSGGLDGNGHGFAVTNVEGDTGDGAVRTRSSSVDLSDDTNHPAPMQIVGSICEDGLGLISWWKSSGEETEEDEMAFDDEYDVDGGNKMSAIEYVFNTLQTRLQMGINGVDNVFQLVNKINVIIGGMPSFKRYFLHVGFPDN